MTLLADTTIPPVTFMALMTIPAVVAVIDVALVSVVPAGTPVFVATGFTAGSAGNVAQGSLLGGGETGGALNFMDLALDADASDTMTPGEFTTPFSGSADMKGVAASDDRSRTLPVTTVRHTPNSNGKCFRFVLCISLLCGELDFIMSVMLNISLGLS